jgi:hypothetical protein
MRKLTDKEICVVMERAVELAQSVDADVSRAACMLDLGDGYVARVSVGLFTKQVLDQMAKATKAEPPCVS